MDGGFIIYLNGDLFDVNKYCIIYKCFMFDEGKIGFK